jgi:hypothetical protein
MCASAPRTPPLLLPAALQPVSRMRVHTLRMRVHTLRMRVHTLRMRVHTLRMRVHTLRMRAHTLQMRMHTLRMHPHTLWTSKVRNAPARTSLWLVLRHAFLF